MIDFFTETVCIPLWVFGVAFPVQLVIYYATRLVLRVCADIKIEGDA